MKPVVVDPTVTLAQLFSELAATTDTTHRDAVRDQIIVRLRRRLTRLTDEARARYQAEAGETPEETLTRFHEQPAADVAAWAQARPAIGALLDGTAPSDPASIPISHHPDQIAEVSHGYGTGEKPEDFLDGFTAFVHGNLNQIAHDGEDGRHDTGEGGRDGDETAGGQGWEQARFDVGDAAGPGVVAGGESGRQE